MNGDLILFVSDALTRKRVSAGLSVEDLARMTGIPAAKLAEYESDSSGMDFRSLKLVADALEEDITVFFSGFVLDRQRSVQDAIDS